jgi:mono/diheme cytochrome c family protein
MYNQPRFDASAESDLFPDHRTNRPIPAGTVAQGFLKDDDFLSRGKAADGTFARGFPMEVTAATLARGEERYNIYCTPCHGPVGLGDGMVAKRGFAGVANLHDERIRGMAEGELYSAIANGIRIMPSYGLQVNEQDRWAIVAYLRALQRSQNAKTTDLNEADQKRLSVK